MEWVRRINEIANSVFVVFGGIALMLMMAIACLNMVLRLLGAPISGAYELVGYLGALTVALPLGYTQLRKSHIAVDILSKLFPPVVRRIILSISLFVGMVFFFVAAWKVWTYAATLKEAGEVSETLRIPFYPFTFGVAISCGLMTFCLLLDLISVIVPSEEKST